MRFVLGIFLESACNCSYNLDFLNVWDKINLFSWFLLLFSKMKPQSMKICLLVVFNIKFRSHFKQVVFSHHWLCSDMRIWILFLLVGEGRNWLRRPHFSSHCISGSCFFREVVRATSAEIFTWNTWARTGCRVGLVVQKGHSVFNYLVINHPSSGPGTLSEPALLGRFLMISGLTPTLLASALGATKTLGKPAGGRGDHTRGPGAGQTWPPTVMSTGFSQNGSLVSRAF